MTDLERFRSRSSLRWAAAVTAALGAAISVQRGLHAGAELGLLTTGALALLAAVVHVVAAWRGSGHLPEARWGLGIVLCCVLSGTAWYPLPGWAFHGAGIGCAIVIASAVPRAPLLALLERGRPLAVQASSGLVAESLQVAPFLITAGVFGVLVRPGAAVLPLSLLLPHQLAALVTRNALWRLALTFAMAPIVHLAWQGTLLTVGCFTATAQAAFLVLATIGMCAFGLRRAARDGRRIDGMGAFGTFAIIMLPLVLVASRRAIEDPIDESYNSQHVLLVDLARTWTAAGRWSVLPYDRATVPSAPLYYAPGPLPFVLMLTQLGDLPLFDPALGLITPLFNAAAIACLASAVPRPHARHVLVAVFAVALLLIDQNRYVIGYFHARLHHDAFTIFSGAFWPAAIARLGRRARPREVAALLVALGATLLGKPHIFVFAVSFLLGFAVFRAGPRVFARGARGFVRTSGGRVAIGVGVLALLPGAVWYVMHLVHTGHVLFPQLLPLQTRPLIGSFPSEVWGELVAVAYRTGWGDAPRWDRIAPWLGRRIPFFAIIAAATALAAAAPLAGRAQRRFARWEIALAAWSIVWFGYYAALPVFLMSFKYFPIFDGALVFAGSLAALRIAARSLRGVAGSGVVLGLGVAGAVTASLLAVNGPWLTGPRPARVDLEAATQQKHDDFAGLARRLRELPHDARVLTVALFDHVVTFQALWGRHRPIATGHEYFSVENAELFLARDRGEVIALLRRHGYTHVLSVDDDFIRSRFFHTARPQPFLHMILERDPVLVLADRQRVTPERPASPWFTLYRLDFARERDD